MNQHQLTGDFVPLINPQTSSKRKRTQRRTRDFKDEFVKSSIIILSVLDKPVSISIQDLCNNMGLKPEAFYLCFLNKADYLGYLSMFCEKSIKSSLNRLDFSLASTLDAENLFNIINMHARPEAKTFSLLSKKYKEFELRKEHLRNWLLIKFSEHQKASKRITETTSQLIQLIDEI